MLAIIGCGNSNRSDDGVGPCVAQALLRHLHERPRADVRVFDAGTGGMEVMFQARGADRLIVIDACTSGFAPGALFEVPGAELEREHEPTFNLHDFRWDHALAAGRRIFRDQFPRQVSVFLIEAQSIELGLDLSAPVRAAAELLVQRLMRVIDDDGADPLTSAQVCAGTLQLSREACERYLRGAESVALLERNDRVLLLPLTRESGGGLLLKLRNARGDRVVQAQEFFRQHGYAEHHEPRHVAMHWDQTAAALVLTGIARVAAPAN